MGGQGRRGFVYYYGRSYSRGRLYSQVVNSDLEPLYLYLLFFFFFFSLTLSPSHFLFLYFFFTSVFFLLLYSPFIFLPFFFSRLLPLRNDSNNDDDDNNDITLTLKIQFIQYFTHTCIWINVTHTHTHTHTHTVSLLLILHHFTNSHHHHHYHHHHSRPATEHLTFSLTHHYHCIISIISHKHSHLSPEIPQNIPGHTLTKLTSPPGFPSRLKGQMTGRIEGYLGEGSAYRYGS